MISVNIHANTSPMAGQEGTKISLTTIKERLTKEAENDVSLRVIIKGKGDSSDGIEVQARGDLHLGVLFEKLRREGFEISITPPQVVFKEENGKKLEPVEKVTIEVADQYTSLVIDKLMFKSATLVDCINLEGGRQQYEHCFRSITQLLIN